MKIFKWKPSKSLVLFVEMVLGLVTLSFAYKALLELDLVSAFARGFNWGWFAVAALLLFGSLAVRSLILSRGILPELTDSEALYAVSFGNAMNMLLPFKLGEGMRYTVLPGDMTTKEKLMVMVFPAIFDTFYMGMSALLSALFARVNEEWYKGAILAAGIVLCAVSLLAAGGIALFGKRTIYAEALRRLGVKGFLYMGLSWFFFISSAMISFVTVGMSLPDAIRAGVFSHVATSLSMLFPVSPGSIGLFEYAVVFGMSLQGINGGAAASAAVTLHIVQYTATLPVGLGFFAYNKIKNRKEKLPLRKG